MHRATGKSTHLVFLTLVIANSIISINYVLLAAVCGAFSLGFWPKSSLSSGFLFRALSMKACIGTGLSFRSFLAYRS